MPKFTALLLFKKTSFYHSSKISNELYIFLTAISKLEEMTERIKKIGTSILKTGGFYKSNRFKGVVNAGNKRKIFFSLLPLTLKKRDEGNKNELRTVNFLKYKISGYRYRTIEFLINEIFVSNDYWFAADTDKPIIIDCGANIGVSIMYFLNLYPNAEILGFEPNPFVFELLKKNLSENNLHATLENCALCKQSCLIPFYISDDYGTLTGSIINERGGENKIEIEGKQLSKFVSKYSKIDVIKIDTEGAEIEIIDDLFENNLLTVADNYLIEFHHNIKNVKTSLSDFLRKFEDSGFEYSIKTEYEMPGKFQDVFLHFYKTKSPAHAGVITNG
ncbi:MAG TPA: FkbM family methyltransferase [Mucilaginibacter sp.]